MNCKLVRPELACGRLALGMRPGFDRLSPNGCVELGLVQVGAEARGAYIDDRR